MSVSLRPHCNSYSGSSPRDAGRSPVGMEGRSACVSMRARPRPPHVGWTRLGGSPLARCGRDVKNPEKNFPFFLSGGPWLLEGPTHLTCCSLAVAPRAFRWKESEFLVRPFLFGPVCLSSLPSCAPFVQPLSPSQAEPLAMLAPSSPAPRPEPPASLSSGRHIFSHALRLGPLTLLRGNCSPSLRHPCTTLWTAPYNRPRGGKCALQVCVGAAVAYLGPQSTGSITGLSGK